MIVVSEEVFSYLLYQLSHETVDSSVFEEQDFAEALRFLEFELSLVNVERPSEPTPSHHLIRPTLHFLGRISGNARVKGKVYMTPDEQVRWSFVRQYTALYLQVADTSACRCQVNQVRPFGGMAFAIFS